MLFASVLHNNYNIQVGMIDVTLQMTVGSMPWV